MSIGPRPSNLSSPLRVSDTTSAAIEPGGGLTNLLDTFLRTQSVHKWHGRLSALQELERLPESAAPDRALVYFPRDITPRDQHYAARKLASELTDPLACHQLLYGGDHAMVRIIGPSEFSSLLQGSQVSRFPDAPLRLDLDGFRAELEEQYRNLGATLVRTTLYTVRLGEVSYHMALLRGDLQPNHWPGYSGWRSEVKERYQVDLRPIYEPLSRAVSIRIGRSFLPAETTVVTEGRVQFSTPETSRPLPQGWRSLGLDWTQRMLLSLDGPQVADHEDLLSAYYLQDGSIKLSVCLPCTVAGCNDFPLGREKLAIGQEIVVDPSGEARTDRVALVVAQNRARIDTTTAGMVLRRLAARGTMADEELPIPSRAVRMVENDWHSSQQITALSEVAARIIDRRLSRCEPMALDILGSSMERPREFRGELIVAETMRLSQEQIAQWFVNEAKEVPYLAMRPRYHYGAGFSSLSRRHSWLTTELLGDVSRRRDVFSRLALEDPGSISRLVYLLKEASVDYKIEVISTPENLRYEDRVRVKSAHLPLIGSVNQVQAAALLLGTPGYRKDDLQEIAEILNLPRDTRARHTPLAAHKCEKALKRARIAFRERFAPYLSE